MNPKFAVMMSLNEEEMERDSEIAATKMRYEIKRQQAGAELGQAQPQLGFWELISLFFKVDN